MNFYLDSHNYLSDLCGPILLPTGRVGFLQQRADELTQLESVPNSRNCAKYDK